jgi:hypothetical protein
MSLAWRRSDDRPDGPAAPVPVTPLPHIPVDEQTRLLRENRRMAITLGGFTSFLASRGLLEEAWEHISQLHSLED